MCSHGDEYCRLSQSRSWLCIVMVNDCKFKLQLITGSYNVNILGKNDCECEQNITETEPNPRLFSKPKPKFKNPFRTFPVLTDILLAVDAGDLSAIVLLEILAALDTVDHGILLHRLDSSYQIVGSVLYSLALQRHISIIYNLWRLVTSQVNVQVCFNELPECYNKWYDMICLEDKR